MGAEGMGADGIDRDVTIVIPTIGRPSLERLLAALSEVPARVIVVDDRPSSPSCPPLALGRDPRHVSVLRSGGRGPAAARNIGWRHAQTRWVSFLDDDVLPRPGWWRDLQVDIREADAVDAAASAARLRVPRPLRRPTDAERNTIALEKAAWITADLLVRRSALARVGGFDERFTRAYREDADLALRLRIGGHRLVLGVRVCDHPLRSDPWHASLRAQRGNADDSLMRQLHGPRWRAHIGEARGRRRRHAATTVLLAAAVAGPLAGRRSITAAALAAWVTLTAEFAASRVRPGPRDAGEITRMVATSAAIPPAAMAWALLGWLRWRSATPWRGLPDLVVLDRDGTLVMDIPYNGDPRRLELLDGAALAVDRLRSRGMRLALATNQSGVARGLISSEQMRAVNEGVEDLVGHFDIVLACPHAPEDGCGCRKPRPGMVLHACENLDVDPQRCVVVGDIWADVGAALAAGAHPILVPRPETSAEDVERAPKVAASLMQAVETIVQGRW